MDLLAGEIEGAFIDVFANFGKRVKNLTMHRVFMEDVVFDVSAHIILIFCLKSFFELLGCFRADIGKRVNDLLLIVSEHKGRNL